MMEVDAALFAARHRGCPFFNVCLLICVTFVLVAGSGRSWAAFVLSVCVRLLDGVLSCRLAASRLLAFVCWGPAVARQSACGGSGDQSLVSGPAQVGHQQRLFEQA